MKNEEINVSVSVAEKETTLKILRGEAPDPINPVAIRIEGNIHAVKDFIQGRPDIDKTMANIRFNETGGSVTLTTKEQLPDSITIFACLEEYPELQKFGINQAKRFTQRELESLIKMSRIFFPTGDTHTELLKQIKEFSAKVSSSIQNQADSRGNKNLDFKKEVTSGLAEEFTLKMPIYKGTDPKLFRVEICYDVTDASVSFWFESVELFEMKKNTVWEVFSEQSEQFKKEGFTVIHS